MGWARCGSPSRPPSCAVGAQLERLGILLTKRRTFDEAEPLLLESYDIASTNEDPGHKQAHHRAESLARLYDAWGRSDRAQEWRTKARG